MFAELGRAPTAVEVGAAMDEAADTVTASWRRLHDAHTLVLDGSAIRMAHPFSAVPTPFRVDADGRSWYANCAWDAFGICAALGVDGHIDTTCPDCASRLSIDVRQRQPDDTTVRFHSLVPAAQWWDDIVFT